MDRFDLLQILGQLFLVIVATHHARLIMGTGKKPIAIDRHRLWYHICADLSYAGLLGAWIYLSMAYPLGLPLPEVPRWMDIVLIAKDSGGKLGVSLLFLGLAIYAAGLKRMGDSWRIGIDRKTPGELVTDGIFSWSRNPLYLGLNLFVFGVFFIRGRLLFLLLAQAMAFMFDNHARREEKFLSEEYGEAYLHYRDRVNRYFGRR